MSTNPYQSNLKKLRSPILDPICSPEKPKGKKTYYNPQEEKPSEQKIDETIDNVLFCKPAPQAASVKKEIINSSSITSLETIFKIGSILILATGGMLTLLEFIIIARTLITGSFDFGNSIIVFTAALIGTILSNLICLGFIHLIKTTKYIYINNENQRLAINKIKLLSQEVK